MIIVFARFALVRLGLSPPSKLELGFIFPCCLSLFAQVVVIVIFFSNGVPTGLFVAL